MVEFRETKVSTIGTICQEIQQAAQPLSIIMFGANCTLKSQILTDFTINLEGVAVYHGAPSQLETAAILHSQPISVFVLDSLASIERGLIQRSVQLLHEIGMETVIGLYIEAYLNPLRRCASLSRKDAEAERCARALINDPPTGEAFDRYLVAVNKEVRDR